MAKGDGETKVRWGSAQLLTLVQAQRHDGEEWCFIRELSNGTGSNKNRSIDAWAMNLWPSKQFRSVAYEVKVSRSDFARELEDPSKRGAAEEIAGECWFLTPSGLVRPDEVPEGWGLVVAREDGSLATQRMPTQRKVVAPTLEFFAAVARRSRDPKIDVEVAKIGGRTVTLSHLERLIVRNADRRHQQRGRGAEVEWGAARQEKRERVQWIEAEILAACGWGATRTREALKAALEKLRATGTDLDPHAVRSLIIQLGNAHGLQLVQRVADLD